MEKRHWKRLETCLEVEVRRPDEVTRTGRIENIGLGGAYINVDANDLDKQDIVEIVLPEHSVKEACSCRVRAWVVHRSDRAIGVSFNAIDIDDYGCLRRFIDRELLAAEQQSKDNAAQARLA